MLWAWADAPGPSGSAPGEGGAVALDGKDFKEEESVPRFSDQRIRCRTSCCSCRLTSFQFSDQRIRGMGSYSASVK